MSPSKRLGGMIDPSAEHPVARRGESAPSSAGASGNGNGSGNGHATSAAKSASSAMSARPHRTTLEPGLRAATPRRGTASGRGASSSTITRRIEDVPAPAAPAARSLQPPAPRSRTPRRDRLSAPVAPIQGPPRPATASTALDLAPAVIPAVVPSTRPETGGVLDRPLDPPPLLGPSIAHEPPPPQASFTSHTIAPVPRVLGRRPRVRKVTRVVRHVDPWSVFKIAAVFNLVLYGVALTAGVLLWNVAYATGTIDNLERFFESFGWNSFEFNGGQIYHSLWVAGLFGVVGLTGAAVLAATLFNLITDLVGGVRFTVLEEEVVERTAAPMRRFVVRRQTADGDPAGPLTVPPTTLPARPDPPPG